MHAYLDGELDPVHAIEMERRLAADPALAAERDRIAALRARDSASNFRPSRRRTIW